MPVPPLLRSYAAFPFTLERGEGCRIFDSEGRDYLDLYGGHCVCLTGHSHPRLAEAVAEQTAKLHFYSTAATMEIREKAAEALVGFAGEPMASAFFVNSGAEANENALKVAVKRTGRTKIACVAGGWHGRSLMCLAATDDPPITEPFRDLLAPSLRLPFNDLPALEQADLSDCAALIVEPIQSMAGAREVSSGWLHLARRKCDEAGALLIFDEIQTGMGRMGVPFAHHSAGAAPDIICLAKGLASGVPMGAILVSEAVADGIKPGDLGSTFGGGPIACAALLATIEIIRDENLIANAARQEEAIRAAHPKAQGRGLLLGLLFDDAPAVKKALLERRILVGGSKDPTALRVMPPLTLSDEETEEFTGALKEICA